MASRRTYNYNDSYCADTDGIALLKPINRTCFTHFVKKYPFLHDRSKHNLIC